MTPMPYNETYDAKLDHSYDTNGNNDNDEKPQYYSDIAEANPVSRRLFIRKVYIILFTQLLITAGAGFMFYRLTRENEFVRENGRWLMIGFAVGAIACVCTLSCCAESVRAFPRNYIFLTIFTAILSCFVGLVSARYDSESLLVSAGITTGLFLGLTLFAVFVTKDFTGFGPYLFAASLVMILFGIAIFACGFFMDRRDNTYKWLRIGLSIFGVILFSFYIIFDTQQIVGGKNRKILYSVDDYVFAAISLYLDVINLFLCILGLAGDN
eukprot:GEMP01069010.1.p1 GENE.GEMP01069010.1~~GEMP01069010.1.p1  ORF type:complete len:299 (+),score=24.46 GEMP01069010.1:95-898(+)